QEYRANREKVKQISEKAADWVPRVVPQVMSFSVFLGGAILLFSGALPSEVPRMQWLQHFIPLPVIEMSHFFASIVGTALLILARGLQRRIDGAYHLTIGMLVFGIAFSILKGANFEEAIILAIMLIALIPCREEFHRKASLLAQQFSAGWYAMIFMVLASAVWLGLFSYHNVEYQNKLWWEFTLTGDAPRYLRATVAAMGCAVIFGLVKLLRPRRKKEAEPKETDLKYAKQILSKSHNALSNLVLLKDKELLLNDERSSFIMYTKESKSCLALGDPVGPEEESEEMIWEFYDQCSGNDYWPVFYRVGSKCLEYYVDLGLTMFKMGEEARVPLANFDVNTHLNSQVLTNYQEIKETGYSWEILPEQHLNDYLPDLKVISDASINSRNRKERGFSVGYFDEDYLSNFPVAVVKKDGQLLAFSNLLQSSNQFELTTDLLRFRPEVPDKIIDYMLVETILWGQKQHYKWFSLGMAPFSGMDEDDFSPGWNKLADFIYTYGENFYGFKTVRAYKEQFQPVWEPKFLVCPGGWILPRVLSNLTNVVSGGFSNLVN
ncbi:MAG TPA: bifunctional lysylphosphatidylglycerol flippase/synthetase MprF, partial [Balneolaceae bacterium]|nr:bifunctional lysylphosphatidylglycerol flippase/synthetase MprF [Balneolaceae bacterium]